ncbi:MAG: hypothetical protein QW841_02380 [Candidatus Aenigmatarchaeota archaeon]
MPKEEKIVAMALLSVLYLIVTVFLALMAGPILGTAIFVVLIFFLGLILAFAIPKLRRQ